MTSIIDTHANNINEILIEVQTKLTQMKRAKKDQKGKLSSDIEEQIKDADKELQNMQYEIKTLKPSEKKVYRQKKDQFQRQIDDLRAALETAKSDTSGGGGSEAGSSSSDGKKARGGGGDAAGDIVIDNDRDEKRKRRAEAQDRKNQESQAQATQDALAEANRIKDKSVLLAQGLVKDVHETEAIAEETAKELDRQTEELNQILKDLEKIDVGIKRGQKELSSFIRRMRTDKFIMIIVVILVLLILGAIVFFVVYKLYGKVSSLIPGGSSTPATSATPAASAVASIPFL